MTSTLWRRCSSRSARSTYGTASTWPRGRSRASGSKRRPPGPEARYPSSVMELHAPGRRDFLKMMTAFAAVGACRGTGALAAAAAYNPAAVFDVGVSEVEFRRNKAGRMLMARVYQPKGAGPFPTVLDLHGGAWNAKDRHAEEPMDRALAASGVLVVAIDLTLAPEAPY